MSALKQFIQPFRSCLPFKPCIVPDSAFIAAVRIAEYFILNRLAQHASKIVSAMLPVQLPFGIFWTRLWRLSRIDNWTFQTWPSILEVNIVLKLSISFPAEWYYVIRQSGLSHVGNSQTYAGLQRCLVERPTAVLWKRWLWSWAAMACLFLRQGPLHLYRDCTKALKIQKHPHICSSGGQICPGIESKTLEHVVCTPYCCACFLVSKSVREIDGE